MTDSTVKSIKRAQKESQFLREISQLFMQLALDDTKLQNLTINRVQLSPDKGVCTVYFYSSEGAAKFEELLGTLKLYKPSLRKALASSIKSRYVPELIFRFDDQFEKLMRIEKLIDKVKGEDQQ